MNLLSLAKTLEINVDNVDVVGENLIEVVDAFFETVDVNQHKKILKKIDTALIPLNFINGVEESSHNKKFEKFENIRNTIGWLKNKTGGFKNRNLYDHAHLYNSGDLYDQALQNSSPNSQYDNVPNNNGNFKKALYLTAAIILGFIISSGILISVLTAAAVASAASTAVSGTLVQSFVAENLSRKVYQSPQLTMAEYLKNKLGGVFPEIYLRFLRVDATVFLEQTDINTLNNEIIRLQLLNNTEIQQQNRSLFNVFTPEYTQEFKTRKEMIKILELCKLIVVGIEHLMNYNNQHPAMTDLIRQNLQTQITEQDKTIYTTAHTIKNINQIISLQNNRSLIINYLKKFDLVYKKEYKKYKKNRGFDLPNRENINGLIASIVLINERNVSGGLKAAAIGSAALSNPNIWLILLTIIISTCLILLIYLIYKVITKHPKKCYSPKLSYI